MWMAALLGLIALIEGIQWRRSGLSLVHFLGLGLFRAYSQLWHCWTSNGPLPLFPKGPALIVANHTCATDPAFITAGSSRPFGFLLAEEYYHIWFLRPLFAYIGCLPVKRDGYDVAALRRAGRLLSAGEVLCIFPEGDLSNAGRSRPRPGKLGVAWLALRSRAPVYPVGIAGGPRTSDVLPAWLKPSRVRVAYGPPLDLSAYHDRPLSRALLAEVTDRIMDEITRLCEQAARPRVSKETHHDDAYTI